MSKHNRYKKIACLLATAALASSSSSVFAAAFQLMEQSATNLGTAYAGTAALAIDASVGFYNAAGLTRICEEQVALSAVGILSHNRLRIDRATDTTGGVLPGLPASTRVKGSGIIPGLHYAGRLDDCWTFGLNVVTPFGLQSNYLESSPARYMATRSELCTYDIAPSLAYNMGNGFSIGAGPDFVYGLASLDKTLLIAPGAPDSQASLRLGGWGVGGHVGVLYEFNDCTRIGLNYRSPVTIKARGKQNLSGPAAAVLPSITEIKSTLTLPETAVVSAYHQFNDCWAVMADAQWTNWRSLKTLRVDDLVTGTFFEQTHNFVDTWRFALGTSYQFDECWLGRVGVAYDRSPVRNELRTTRIPDSDRTWVAIGARYNLTPCLALDAGYAHLFFKNSTINQGPDRRPGGSGETLRGNYRASASVLGVQVTWDIG